MNHFMLVIKGLRPPVGEIYDATEAANGELGFYLVSDGTGRPYRLHARAPCFAKCRTRAVPSPPAAPVTRMVLMGSIQSAGSHGFFGGGPADGVDVVVADAVEVLKVEEEELPKCGRINAIARGTLRLTFRSTTYRKPLQRGWFLVSAAADPNDDDDASTPRWVSSLLSLSLSLS